MKKPILVILGMFFLVVAGVVILSPSPSIKKSNKISVVASFFPIAEFAKGAGGDLVNVTYITPLGIEPHDYEPTPREIDSIYGANLFLYNGGAIDPWAEKTSLNLFGRVHSVNMLKEIVSQDGLSEDPHVWLDPVYAEGEAKNIAEHLSVIDSEHAQTFQQNYIAYAQKIEALREYASSSLANCAKRDIVVAHDAFSYFGKRFNLKIIPIAGISPEEEPSPARMAEIVEFVKENGITTIFFEPLLSSRLAYTIAEEAGVQIKVLNPIEGITPDEEARGEDYFSLMKKNIDTISETLLCLK